MAKYYYNGVLLPEIPEDILSSYPYVFIGFVVSTGKYQILASKQKMYVSNGTVTRQNSNAEPYLSCLQGDETWTIGASGNYGWTIDTDRQLVWANHDLGNGAVSNTYFDGSEPVPENAAGGDEEPGGDDEPAGDGENYQIERATLEGLGDQVRRLCNVEGVLQPPQMTAKLEGLNIDLEEAYVSATTEEQTITPSEGYYGFSKIVVEAVEEDDGGGSGTGGGGTGESYPDAESTTFGCEYVESTVLTGRYTYNLNNGSKLGPITGFPVVYAYQYMDYSSFSSKFNVYQTEEPLVYYNGNLYPPSPCKYIGYSYDSTNDEWTELGSGTVTSYMALTGFRWANYTIGMRNEEGVFYTGSQAIPETTTGAVAQPLAREDTYTISGNTLNSIGASVQQITGIDATTPAGMAAALQSYFGLNTDTTE